MGRKHQTTRLGRSREVTSQVAVLPPWIPGWPARSLGLNRSSSWRDFFFMFFFFRTFSVFSSWFAHVFFMIVSYFRHHGLYFLIIQRMDFYGFDDGLWCFCVWWFIMAWGIKANSILVYHDPLSGWLVDGLSDWLMAVHKSWSLMAVDSKLHRVGSPDRYESMLMTPPFIVMKLIVTVAWLIMWPCVFWLWKISTCILWTNPFHIRSEVR